MGGGDRDCDFPDYRSEDSDRETRSGSSCSESSCWGNGCFGCLVAWFAIGLLANCRSDISDLGVMINNSSAKEANRFFKTNESRFEQLILDYQRNIRPALQERLNDRQVCIYQPNCSEYGLQAVRKYGDLRGGFMAAARIVRCNPFSKGGHDPVR